LSVLMFVGSQRTRLRRDEARLRAALRKDKPISRATPLGRCRTSLPVATAPSRAPYI